MTPMRRLKHTFLIVAGSLTISVFGQDQKTITPNQNNIEQTTNNEKEQTAKFDYAFGDQTAASLNLPGVTGDNWDVADTWYAFKAFLKKNPDALKGKNVFVAIGDSSMLSTLLHGPQMAKRMIAAVGDEGNIVLLGVSETRTDMDGKWANDLIKKKMKKYGGIYGGAMINASSKEKIYPTTAAEFKSNQEQAQNILKTYLDKKNATFKASPKQKTP